MGKYERFSLKPRPISRNTINGVLVDRLDGHLPPPVVCEVCGYDWVWLLDAPNSVNQDGKVQSARWVAEYSRTLPPPRTDAVPPAMPSPHPHQACFLGMCDHPYHLIPHAPMCRRDRVDIPLLPDGLLTRPPR